MPADKYRIFRLAKLLTLMRSIMRLLPKTIFVTKIFIKSFLKCSERKIFWYVTEHFLIYQCNRMYMTQLIFKPWVKVFSPASYYRVAKTKIHKEKLFYDLNAFVQSPLGWEGACVFVCAYFLANYGNKLYLQILFPYSMSGLTFIKLKWRWKASLCMASC